MKAIIQRVKSASVTVDSQIVSSIGKGLLVLAAVGPNDTVKDAETLAGRILKIRLWSDERERNWEKSVQDVGGEVLCVSQFTLYASTKKGNKPDFHGAAKPEVARALYEHLVEHMKKLYGAPKVQQGIFQAMMDVALVNDGPVTVEIETGVSRKTGTTSGPASSQVSTPGPGTGTATPVSESAS